MRAVPKCATMLNVHLDEMQRKEEIEILRRPLKAFNLFPPQKDPDTAPVTMEELKKLVRHWKLHEQRGFWKKNSEKDELIQALLEHIRAQETPGPPPETPNSGRRVRPGRSGRMITRTSRSVESALEDLDHLFKPYGGDLFGHTEGTDGIIYLSRTPVRQNALSSTSVEKTLFGKNIHQELSESDRAEIGPDLITCEASAKAGEDVSAGDVTAAQNERNKQCAMGLYNFSCLEGAAHRMVFEGALTGLLNLVDIDDDKTCLYAVAALCNLTRDPSVRRKLMEAHVIEAFSRLAGSDNSKIQLFVAVGLAQLACEENCEAIFGEESGLSALQTLSDSKNDYIKTTSIIALVNLMQCDSKYHISNTLAPAVTCLAMSSSKEQQAFIAQSICMLTCFEHSRLPLIRSDAVSVLSNLLQQNPPRKGGHNQVPMHICTALFNLSCCAEARDEIITGGGVRPLVALLEYESSEAKRLSAFTLLNLTANATLAPQVVVNGAVPALGKLCKDSRLRFDIRVSAGASLCNLTVCADVVGTMVEQNSLEGFTSLALTLTSDARVGTNFDDAIEKVLIGICNLLCDPDAHSKMISSGVLGTIRILAGDLASAPPKVVHVFAVTLANLASSVDERAMLLEQGLIQALVGLSKHAGVEQLRLCAMAFASLSTDLSSGKTMLELGAVKALITMCGSDDVSILKYCSTTLCNLANNDDLLEALMEQGAMDSLLRLCQSNDSETLLRCAGALCSLSGKGNSHDQLLQALSIVNQTNNNEILERCALAFFSLSCNEESFELMASDTSIPKGLIGTMRGGQVSTQLHSAEALCNLTCHEGCAEMLLNEGAISDFVVIAILRTNSVPIKEMCCKALFNLLGHEKCRMKMVSEGVLWALVKMSRIDSQNAQEMCARAIFNLSCYEETQQKIMDIGLDVVLAAIAADDTAKQMEMKYMCVGALCNLSWRVDDRLQLIQEGAVKAVLDIVFTGGDPADNSSSHNDVHILQNCATIMYNLALVEDGIIDIVEQGAIRVVAHVVKAIVTNEREADSLAQHNLIKCSLALHNISCGGGSARREMVADGASSVLVQLIGTGDENLHRINLTTSYQLSRTEECVAKLIEAGLVEAIQKVPNADEDIANLCSKIICSMTFDEDNRSHLIQKGIASALAHQCAFLSATARRRREAAAALYNLSFVPDHLSTLLDAGIVRSVHSLIVDRPLTTVEHSITEGDCRHIERQCAIIIRNVASSPANYAALAEDPQLMAILNTMATASDSDIKYDVAEVLCRLLGAKESEQTMINKGAIGVLITLSEDAPEELKKIARVTIAAQSTKTSDNFADGAVVALLSLMDHAHDDHGANNVNGGELGFGEVLEPISLPHTITLDKEVEFNKRYELEPKWSKFFVEPIGNRAMGLEPPLGLQPTCCIPDYKFHTSMSRFQFKKLPFKPSGLPILPVAKKAR